MKRIYFLLILLLILAMFLVGCGTTPPNILSANFIITDWEQSYYEYIGEWSDYVYVYYEVENTGNVEIDYYICIQFNVLWAKRLMMVLLLLMEDMRI